MAWLWCCREREPASSVGLYVGAAVGLLASAAAASLAAALLCAALRPATAALPAADTGAGAGAGEVGAAARLHGALSCALLLALLQLAGSAGLLLGLRQSRPGPVVWHVAASVFVSIGALLGALLALLARSWLPAAALAAAAVVNLWFVGVVHSALEAMARGKQLGFAAHERLAEPRDEH